MRLLEAIIQNLRLVPLTRRSVVNIRWYSKDEDSSDDERGKIKKEVKSDEAIKRLNELLNSMSSNNAKTSGSIVMPRDQKKEAKMRKEKRIKDMQEDPSDLREVTKKIAEKIGGDVQKTESELLSTLLGMSETKSSLSDVIGGLKVEKEESPQKSRAQTVREALPKQFRQPRKDREPRQPTQRRDRRAQEYIASDLFGGTPLGIFEKASDATDPCEMWSFLEKKELKLAVTHPPRNHFEKMAMWTDQGKIWKFPIDNEQGWNEEHNTDFTEHIMLEQHLEGWCPTKGPVRHFMELVCVGLSKNIFYSAKEKKEHIMFYKTYFEEKKEYLGELMTMGIEDDPKDQTKQVEG